jgi:K+-dependent Na+/Ca+ exchanger-like protein
VSRGWDTRTDCSSCSFRRWEALIQFLLYIGYVVLMYFNVKLNTMVRACLGLKSAHDEAATIRKADTTMIEKANAAAGVGRARATFQSHVLHHMFFEQDPRGKGKDKAKDMRFVRAVDIIMERLLTQKEDSSQVAPRSLDKLKWAVKRVSAEVQKPGDKAVTQIRVASRTGELVPPPVETVFSGAEIATAADGVSSDEKSSVSADGIKPATRSKSHSTVTPSGPITLTDSEPAEGATVPEKSTPQASPMAASPMAASPMASPKGSSPQVTPPKASPVAQDSKSESSIPATGETPKGAVVGGGDESEEGALEPAEDDLLDAGEETVEDMLRWPSSIRGKIWYVFMAPITYTLAYTVPDVRVKGREKWYPVTFLMAILWIAVYAYLMVWWATMVGEVLSIPEAVMGLTFLAAGTSVPDLLTSVLVARQGLGDMAVSSSIGSNIFDVAVGLPLPWILAILIRGVPVTVSSEGLRFSVVLLFLMLATVIISIWMAGWKMSKSLGAAMFVLYGVFLTISLLIEFGVMQAPL